MMQKIKNIAVFCGASLGNSLAYQNAAKELGKLLCERAIGVVYGGSKIGIMGVLADTMLSHQGEVIGVAPEFLLDKEIVHPGISKLHIVKTMHERKALMMELSDGFMLLPGGIGSLEEFIEVCSWGQLGLHKKPCGILNVDHCYDALIGCLDDITQREFMGKVFRNTILAKESSLDLLNEFEYYQAPQLVRHMNSEEQI